MSRACGLARTLKPMIMAPDARASVTSDSLMPPTAGMQHAHGDLVGSAASTALPTIASSEPCTSDLMTTGSSLVSPAAMLREHLLQRAAALPPWPGFPAACWRRNSLTSRARASFSTTTKSSPARGVPCRPSTSTGIDGPALSMCSPRSSTRARTRPHSAPATKMSPTWSVPRWTSTVATAPRPRSSLASITVPVPGRSGLAFRSRISACSRMASSSLSRFSRSLAETSTV